MLQAKAGQMGPSELVEIRGSGPRPEQAVVVLDVISHYILWLPESTG